ncbi:DoxX family membrane protein [Pseudoalteromonas luteoviolacea]|uniref:DoxX family membrane protein n=1 Tax=Pseudoalteromonas luteoviolacea TaxID=43657 RepID=UPI001B393E72|nr:DoxX family membrane protein [Pseudoalteromonas luteoviolacea]MBQ4838542.1 DoxX family membrane protein [Pseudoalteromonas luteoviolacea]
MFADYRLPHHISINICARFLFTSLFLLSGITHFTNVPYYLSLMPEVIPYKVALIWASGIVELAGALMILFNWKPKLGGWLLVLFLLPVTVVVHGYEMLYAEHETIRALQQAHFLKGFSLIGAALLVTQVGVSQKEQNK